MSDAPREIDFLPRWYPRLLRRRRLLRMEMAMAYTAVLIASGISVAAFLDARAASIDYDRQAERLKQTRLEVGQFRQKLRDLRDLQGDARVARKVGLPVEATRVLSALDSAMTPRVSLRNVEMRVEETPLKAEELLLLAGGDDAMKKLVEAGVVPKHRRLRVSLRAIAPDGRTLAAFASQLEKQPALHNVRMQGLSDLNLNGHTARLTEVSFTVNLNHVDGIDAALHAQAGGEVASIGGMP